MDRTTELGQWLRKAREARGIRSAAALSRAAGIALAHTASIERGAFCPTWQTALKLAKALGLSDDERAEFFRRVDAAGKPKVARAATAGPAVPGVIVWKHLPEALYSIRHNYTGLLPPAADRVLPGLIAAGAALLGYRAALQPSADALDALRSAVDDLTSHPASPLSPADWIAPRAVSARLVDRWHGIILATPRAIRRQLRGVCGWDYSTGFTAIGEPRLRFRFRGGLPAVLPQELVRPGWIERAISAFALDLLWRALDLSARFPEGPDFWFYYLPDFRLTLKELDGINLEALAADLHLPAGPLSSNQVARYLLACEHAFGLVQDGMFVSRFANAPAFAALCLGADWQSAIARATLRIGELAPLLPPSRPSPSRPQE